MEKQRGTIARLLKASDCLLHENARERKKRDGVEASRSQKCDQDVE